MKPTILIIGLLGNGLRSIGNSILRENKFKTRVYDRKCYKIHSKENKDIKVITFPLSDKTIDRENIDILEKELYNSNGLDAIVFVLKYGTRYTGQDKDAVKKTEALLGVNVFKENIIIAFSFGDNFQLDHHGHLDINLAFKNWCQQQEGEMKKLFTKVNYRSVLFNNTCKVEEGKRLQFDILCNHISLQENAHKKPIDIDSKQSPSPKKKKNEIQNEMHGHVSECVNFSVGPYQHHEVYKELAPSKDERRNEDINISNNEDKLVSKVKKYTLSDLYKAKGKIRNMCPLF